jgi:hypothetical protein
MNSATSDNAFILPLLCRPTYFFVTLGPELIVFFVIGSKKQQQLVIAMGIMIVPNVPWIVS